MRTFYEIWKQPLMTVGGGQIISSVIRLCGGENVFGTLDADPAARQTFDGLSYSNRSWHVLSIEGAKTEATRQRRIEKSIATLHEGRPR